MSIQVIRTPHGNGMKHLVIGTFDELMDYARLHIRQVSRDFYMREIPGELNRLGTTLVDCHAIGHLTRMALRFEIAPTNPLAIAHAKRHQRIHAWGLSITAGTQAKSDLPPWFAGASLTYQ